MLKQPRTQDQSGSILSVTHQKDQKQEMQQISKMQIDRLLRKPRSKQYMDAMHKLDAGGHTHNHDQVSEIMNIIRNEFPEIEINGVLLGIISECFLGPPYEVHTLDIAGSGIIDHYKAGITLPGGLEKARSIAIRGGYSFIEVYIDCCRAVNSNGVVSVFSC